MKRVIKRKAIIGLSVSLPHYLAEWLKTEAIKEMGEDSRGGVSAIIRRCLIDCMKKYPDGQLPRPLRFAPADAPAVGSGERNCKRRERVKTARQAS